MNFSEIKQEAARQLSRGTLPLDRDTDTLLDSALAELAEIDGFRFLYAKCTTLPGFLQKEPYASFLTGGAGCLLIACTLGAEVERRVRRYALTDPARMAVLDAAAGVYLEHRAKVRILEITPHTSDVFCPGYGGSDLLDNRFIFEILKPCTIGMELTEGGMMLPQKSLCGVVALGVSHPLSCGGCTQKETCPHRKEGTRCFNSAKN